jgi:hypothetical protein
MTQYEHMTMHSRFRTQFFITFLPAPGPGHPSLSAETATISATIATPHPTPDSAHEVLSTAFYRPAHALAGFAAGRVRLFPPQFYLLYALAALLPGARGTPQERARVRALAGGTFGALRIAPRVVRRAPPASAGAGAGGAEQTVILLDGDEEHGGPPGRRHRLLASEGAPGVPMVGDFLFPSIHSFFLA